MVKSHELEVILPLYNGAKYLREQVASIHGQTIRPLRLIARDDDSTDGTKDLISELKDEYGEWLVLLSNNKNVGCSENVNILLSRSTAKYIALADQDDVWLPNKLEKALNKIREVEKKENRRIPILVHSDLYITDKRLRPYKKTYIEQQRLNVKATRANDLMLTNIVTGCTAVMNRELLDIALPIPKEALVHDWWLALVASSFGVIRYVEETSILYRQHGENTIGAKGIGWEYWLDRLKEFIKNPKAGGHTYLAINQVQYFQNRYNKTISILPNLIMERRMRRLVVLLRLSRQERPRKHGPLRTMALYIWLIRYKHKHREK